MEKNIKLRESLKPYISKLMKEAHDSGAPVMRAMFYEFPKDDECWTLRDQYMFGSEYLVAPILHAGQTEREVYLPQGTWVNINDNKSYKGGQRVSVAAPIDCIPVFRRKA